MGLFDRFKPATDDAPEGDDVDLDPQVEDEPVLEEEEAVEPFTDDAVQDLEVSGDPLPEELNE